MNPLTPTPRDSPEDATADPDNGAYGHTCYECNLPFVGHKHRVGLCKVCDNAAQVEADRRAALIAQASLNPEDWVLMPRTEWGEQLYKAVNALLALDGERTLRRKLAAALKVADQTNSNVAYWGHPGRHRDTSEALLAESAKMDETPPTT